PIDPAFTDDNCDGTDGLAEQCVYVSTSLGDDANGQGTRAKPLATIAKAIQFAKTNAVPAVCLSGEIYDEAVTVVSGISIYGGFDQSDKDFPFRRSPKVTTTVRAKQLVFTAPSIDQDTYIEGITIEATKGSVGGSSTTAVLLGGGMGQLYVR